MSFIPIIKQGINTIHRNWQLVLIQFASVILSCISFFVVVGIPIFIAFVMFGLDLTEILRFKDLVSVFKGSAELLQRYFLMAIVIILSFLIYLSFIIILWIFTIGGTIGIIKNSILGETGGFTFRAFLNEGKTLFFPVFLFSSIISMIFLALTFILGLLGGGAAAVIEGAKTYEATLALFLGVFFSLVLLSIGIILILITLSITTYGIANLSFNRHGALDTLKETIRYLYGRPSAIGFYSSLLFGYMVVGFIVILVGSPLALVPVLGPLLSLPYQLVAYAIQGDISLAMLSSVFHYYYNTAYLPTLPGSSEGPDTSQTTTDGQVPPPEQTDETQQT